MSDIRRIGTVSEMKGIFEWKIENFFSYEINAKYDSPAFLVSDSTLCLKMDPSYSDFDGKQYVSLYLCKNSRNIVENFDFQFGVKTVNNDIIHRTGTAKLADHMYWGFPKFIKRPKLVEKSQLMTPLGTLTIVCFIQLQNDASTIYAKRALAEDYKDMFFSKRNTDITFQIKKRKIAAHKIILESRSPVFADMFQNDMSGKKRGVINITDCDPQTFDSFLLFLYSGIVELENCNVCSLYKVADKYNAAELKTICVDFMIKNLSVENFAEPLMLSHQFDEKDLLNEIQRFFNKNFSEILDSNSWQNLFKKNFSLANDLLKAMAPKVSVKD